MNVEPAADALVVQVVRTTWTKRSRSGPLAAVRSAIPRGLPIPGEWTTAAPVHLVRFAEADRFEPWQRCVLPGELPARVRVARRGDKTTVRVDPLAFGFTYRGFHPWIRLTPGRWVQWRGNSRGSSLTGHGDWYYTDETVNIVLGWAGRDVFLGEPDKVVDERVTLR